MLPGIRPVTHLFLSEVTSDSVLVAWSAPAPPADLFILSYSSSDGTDTSKVTLDGSKTASLIQGLLPSTPYTVSLITIQADATSEPIMASLTTGEMLCKAQVRTRSSLSNGTQSFVTIPQEPGLMSLQTFTVTLSCSPIFHTSAPASHQIGFTYSECRFFVFYLLCAVSTVSEGIWGETRKKGRKSHCKCKQMFNLTHRMSGNTDISQLFCHTAMKFPSTIIYALIVVHTPPSSCNSSLLRLLKPFGDISGDYKHAFHIFGKGKQ